MPSSYKRLGDYIQEVNIRNRDLSNIPLLGVSIKKVLMPSIANIIGTDMSTYKLIQKNQFAYGPVTSRNGDKISIALLEEYDNAMVSQAYTVFEVIDESKLLPEYLMMWFRRPEFDRYARFMSHGSAREIFSWTEMCETLLPIPSLEKQQEIVREYNTIQNRIALNNQLISKLEETAQAIYKQWFEDEIDLKNLPIGWEILKLCEFASIKGGKRLPKGEELNNFKNGRPYIKVADMEKTKFLILDGKFQYVSDDIHSLISRYIVNTGDLIISIVGTIGMINIIDESLNKANLTENCFKINNFKKINGKYLYHYLNSNMGKRIIEERTVGGVQGKLPMYNVESMPILIPDKDVLNRFNSIIDKIDNITLIKVKENKILEELKDLLLAKMTRVES